MKLHNRSNLTEQDIHDICLILQNNVGLSIQKIANSLNIGYYVVREIYNGRTWQGISKQYDFSERKKVRGKK